MTEERVLSQSDLDSRKPQCPAICLVHAPPWQILLRHGMRQSVSARDDGTFCSAVVSAICQHGSTIQHQQPFFSRTSASWFVGIRAAERAFALKFVG
jgi:hypothetical protein